MLDSILTLDHALYFALGTIAEVGGSFLVARIKTLAKNPNASLSADALALIEALIDKKVAAAVAPTKAPATVAPLTATTTTAA